MLIGHRNGISRIFLVEITLVGSPAEASLVRVLNCTFYLACCSLESRGGCGEHQVLLCSLIDSFGAQRIQTALADERWLIDSLELACKGDDQNLRVSTKFGDFSLFIGRRGDTMEIALRSKDHRTPNPPRNSKQGSIFIPRWKLARPPWGESLT